MNKKRLGSGPIRKNRAYTDRGRWNIGQIRRNGVEGGGGEMGFRANYEKKGF